MDGPGGRLACFVGGHTHPTHPTFHNHTHTHTHTQPTKQKHRNKTQTGAGSLVPSPPRTARPSRPPRSAQRGIRPPPSSCAPARVVSRGRRAAELGWVGLGWFGLVGCGRRETGHMCAVQIVDSGRSIQVGRRLDGLMDGWMGWDGWTDEVRGTALKKTLAPSPPPPAPKHIHRHANTLHTKIPAPQHNTTQEPSHLLERRPRVAAACGGVGGQEGAVTDAEHPQEHDPLLVLLGLVVHVALPFLAGWLIDWLVWLGGYWWGDGGGDRGHNTNTHKAKRLEKKQQSEGNGPQGRRAPRTVCTKRRLHRSQIGLETVKTDCFSRRGGADCHQVCAIDSLRYTHSSRRRSGSGGTDEFGKKIKLTLLVALVPTVLCYDRAAKAK
jgi:hypothetical protein